MANNSIEPPSFLSSLANAFKLKVEKGTKWELIPVWVLLAGALGFLCASHISSDFWSTDKQTVSTTVYGGILTFNGLALAVSWSAFAKIYEIMGDESFGKHLRLTGLISIYFVSMGITRFILYFAAFLSLMGLVLLLFSTGSWPQVVDRSLIGLTIAFTLYGFRWAWEIGKIMQEMIWYKSHFDAEVRDKVVGIGQAPNQHIK